MKPFYAEPEMVIRLQEARELGFRFPKGSERLSLAAWCRIANGVGPGSWSNTARKISTWLQPFAALGAIFHDVGYCGPIKDRAHFDTINDDFYYNNQLYIRAHTWTISLIRVLALRAAWLEYQAVCLQGWDAFVTGELLWELDDTEIEGSEVKA